ncbi:hypothetical protein ASPFODRAFT_622965 [Aspergillus luchuensis CBS 106.47]|uniref:Uncharacterized protein n=1 Tax=Aspergillus luchuensis (strain CBS 106.47) TaxID=1137211 RepID=A0A1M3TFX0_ASPLC|nr:hypothetical protein ASPFODRAFT_622965 [Aspergillus luchuensis CBS 106.47]
MLRIEPTLIFMCSPMSGGLGFMCPDIYLFSGGYGLSVSWFLKGLCIGSSGCLFFLGGGDRSSSDWIRARGWVTG